ncbi:hypothetical protein BT63DRAFT_450733 [Microthyrium microscopicum]|uniref:Uncharacterized protein n=1 Tax=Microthyrium microscopicum TaxID=703497 RepID=A0A6A6UMP0_9PEZI|nr:hypothetical protein BT63DRAFT_450733 [Microthyrium microscopicum]
MNRSMPKELRKKLYALPQYNLQPLSANQSSLSIRPRELDIDNWLPIDWSYLAFHSTRKRSLDQKKDSAIQYRNGNEPDPVVDAACRNTLELVIEHLTTLYPQFFKLSGNIISNLLTGESFDIDNGAMRPLEIAARLANEDFNILLPIEKEESEVVHQLAATATLFPAGWKIKERIGWHTAQLHGPVPGWDVKLRVGVERSCYRISHGVDSRDQPDTLPDGDSKRRFERLAVFPQIDRPNSSLELLQTFRRLPKVNGLLFTVRTYVYFLDEVDAEETKGLTEQIMALKPDHAAYKQRDGWIDCLLKRCKELGVTPDVRKDSEVAVFEPKPGFLSRVVTWAFPKKS